MMRKVLLWLGILLMVPGVITVCVTNLWLYLEEQEINQIKQDFEDNLASYKLQNLGKGKVVFESGKYYLESKYRRPGATHTMHSLAGELNKNYAFFEKANEQWIHKRFNYRIWSAYGAISIAIGVLVLALGIRTPKRVSMNDDSSPSPRIAT